MGRRARYDGDRASVVLRLVAAGFAVFCLISGVVELRDSTRAMRGDGAIGTFTVTRSECTRRECWSYGRFRAEDDANSIDYLKIENDLGDAAPDKSFRAIRPRGTDRVHLVEGSMRWLNATVSLVVGTVILGWLGFRLLRERRGTTPTPGVRAAGRARRRGRGRRPA
jgi:hypothetical protein